MSAPAPHPLAALDAPRPADDPGVWDDNLAALRAVDPAFAAVLATAPLPPHWRRARALDDALTWRTELPDQPAAWLAGTALPRRRAAALLATYEVGALNATLPGIAAGAELDLLLARLPAHVAVYVFETDLTALAAVLRLHDFAAAVAAHRCLLVPPDDPARFLDDLLARHPGLLPPGNILRLPDVPLARLHAVRDECEAANRRLSHPRASGAPARQQLLQQRLAALPATPAHTDPPRLAVVALTADRRARDAARALADGATAAGWPALVTALDGPHDAHVLPHVTRLADFAPSVVISVADSAARLPAPLSDWARPWFLRAADVPQQLSATHRPCFAASPAVRAALLRAGAPAATIHDLFWAADAEQADHPADTAPSPNLPAAPPPSPPRKRGSSPADTGSSRCLTDVGWGGRLARHPVADLPADAILLVADLPPTNPEAWDITQPTHRILWDHILQAARAAWQTRDILLPDALLTRALRTSGIPLADPDLRHRFIHLIATAAIPAAILEALAAHLAARTPVAASTPPIPLALIGRGWHRLPNLPATILADDLTTAPTPHAALFAGDLDPLSRNLVTAAARGWPILLHTPGGPRGWSQRLGDVLDPTRHLWPFATVAELDTILAQLAADPARAHTRAATARAHLLAAHTWPHHLHPLTPHLSS